MHIKVLKLIQHHQRRTPECDEHSIANMSPPTCGTKLILGMHILAFVSMWVRECQWVKTIYLEFLKMFQHPLP